MLASFFFYDASALYLCRQRSVHVAARGADDSGLAESKSVLRISREANARGSRGLAGCQSLFRLAVMRRGTGNRGRRCRILLYSRTAHRLVCVSVPGCDGCIAWLGDPEQFFVSLATA